MKKKVSGRSVRLLAGFLVFVVVVSMTRNVFFPIVELFGPFGTPTLKLVFGFPTFFVPYDFAGCFVFGARLNIAALAINIAIYSVLVTVVLRLGHFRK
ncbi:MAG: hypothetical protein ACNA8H_06490 [Anaerolineales bacterium]